MTGHPAATDGGSSGRDDPTSLITPAAIRAVIADPESVALSFQPILDVQGARTAGWEILTRFTRGPNLSTDVWFAAAYASGLGPPLEAYVLSRVLPAWRLRSPGTFMTCNVTPAALGDPAIERLVATQAPLHGLVIELTEQLVPRATRCWREACERLRRDGAMIAIDDLGTGYAELAEILALRPDIIKLDRSVVATVDRDPAQQALVRFLGDFCGHLDAWVLAEGVERTGQLDTLRALGVPLAQGWLTGRPGPAPRPCPVELTRGRTPLLRREGTVSAVLRPARVDAADDAADGTADPTADRAGGHRPPGPPEEPAVVLDACGRPSVVVLPRDDDEPSITPATLLVPPDLALTAAARRAMTRPGRQRFDPAVCVDTLGKVIGIVTVQDLVLALADTRTDTRTDTRARSSPSVLPTGDVQL